MIRSTALAVVLALSLALAWFASRTPAPAPVSAPAASFSAERAMTDVRQVAARPHPTGSAENNRVRDYLVGRLRALGFETRIQHARAFTARSRAQISGAGLENVVGVYRGANPGLPALLVMAHYDSVAGSPGGSDDAAGVASALEAARALLAAGTPVRDLMIVFTDGEELGLLGAQAFFDQDPAAGHVGAVVNMDTRGGGGRAYMFETSNGNGALIDLFRKSAVRPTSTSLAVFLYQNMPNGTDFTIPKDKGIVGLNYAFIGRQFDYHAPNSTAESLERGALQHMGEQVLAASRAFAFSATLPEKTADAVYADLFGGPIVAYSPVTGWLVAAVALGLCAFVVARVRRRGGIAWVEVARGAGGALWLLFAFGALFAAIRHGTGIPNGFVTGRPLLAQFGIYETALFAGGAGLLLLTAVAFEGGRARFWTAGLGLGLALVCYPFGHDLVGAALGVLAAVFGALSFGRPVRAWSAWSGFVIVGALLALVTQALAPGVGFLFAWPLIVAGLIGLAATLTQGAFDRPTPILVGGALAVLGAGWLLYLAHPIALGVGADIPPALMPMAWLAALVLAPFALTAPRARLGALAALGVAVVLTGFMALHDPTSAAKPRATHVLYVVDPAANRAWRVTSLPKPDPWTLGVLKRGGGKPVEAMLLPLATDPLWQAPTAMLPVQPGSAVASRTGDQVTLTFTAPPGAERLQLALKSDADLTDFAIDGRAADFAPGKKTWGWLLWSVQPGQAPPVLTFRTKGKVEAHVAFIRPGWPAPDKLVRPKDAMAWSGSDSLVVLGHVGA